MWVCVCVHVPAQSISLFFCLCPYKFFFFYSVSSKSGAKGGVWQGSYVLALKKKKPKTQKLLPERLPAEGCIAAWVLTHRRNKESPEGWVGGKKSPERPSHREASLDIALYPKMQFTGNQALVPALRGLGAVPLTAAHSWKFLLHNLTPTHWNMLFFFFFFFRGWGGGKAGEECRAGTKCTALVILISNVGQGTSQTH